MRRIAVLLALVCALSLSAAPAFATNGSTIPHGGFDTNTDACLQCHDIHEAQGDYVLMRQATMTAVCGTCHTLYLTAPTGAFNPGYSGTEAGTAAGAQAYRVASAQALTHEGHRLGLGSGAYTFADGVSADGSYIPGGTSGLTAIAYLSYPTTDTALAYSATNGMSCASCHGPHGTYGNVLPATVSAAILTSKPNHAAGAVAGVVNWVDDGGKWCASCHDKRMQSAVYNNHPDEACLTCHGDSLAPVDATPDFPHTGEVANLLTLEPDNLCIQCHVASTLP
ncbi:MAG: cytochrome c3 family protein [Coriobacteriia bacterium]